MTQFKIKTNEEKSPYRFLRKIKENMPSLRLLDIVVSGTDIPKLLQTFLLQY